MRRIIGALALVLAAAAPRLGAQGVTTSAVAGTVTDEAGRPIAGAQVIVRNEATGFARATVTNAAGRFFVGNLLPGGPYAVAVRAGGYAPQERRGLQLVLSQTLTVNFQLAQQTVVLEQLTVRAEANPLLSRSRTGAGTVVGERTVERLPTLNRNFTELAVVSPYVIATGDAPSVTGANNRYNNIQIDGAITSDIFGLGASGTPGGQGTPAKPVPLDAIEQFQVLVTPFDVRQTGFTGGLINAVTRSGTNAFRGSFFLNYRNDSFVRRDTLKAYGRTFAPPRDFVTTQYGATFGGPILRDRAFFFLAGEFERTTRPGNLGRNSDPVQIGVRPVKIDSVIAAAQRYGLDPGSADPFTEGVRMGSFLARVDVRLGDNHRLVLRHNATPKWRDDAGISRGGTIFDLTSYNFYYKTQNNSTVLQLFSQFGERFSNELQLNYQTIRDRPTPAVRYSEIQVSTRDTIGGRNVTTRVRLGTEISRQANELDQNILQATNNLTIDLGAHRLLVGANVDYYRFRNLFLQGALGSWTFNSPTDFFNGRAASYTINVPQRADINARFGVVQPGFYVQDTWTVSDAFQLTAGLRLDVPTFLDKPARNDAFQASFGIDNSKMPSGNLLWSPRLGFNLQLGGAQTTQIRGGVGVFTGRPPFVWLSNAFSNTGRDFVTVTCTGTNVPAFNPTTPPTNCPVPVPGSATALVNYIDPKFKYPQELKATLGIDRELPFGFTGSLEVILTRGVNQAVAREVNLAGPQTVPASATQGLGNRLIYGTPQNDTRIAFRPVRRDPNFRHVVELTNVKKSEGLIFTAQLQRAFGDDYSIQAAYTYTRSRDPISMTSSVATSNVGFHPIGYAINDFTLAPSAFERPHKITLVATARVLPRFGGTEISAIYVGQSGRTYSYTYNGDVNGDGYEGLEPGLGGRNNDLVYVPNDVNELTWINPADAQLFDELIQKEPCLRENRGRILPRNACRGPWQNRFDLRITQNVPTARMGRAQLEVNIFNVLNLLNKDWGLQQGPANNTVTLLDFEGRVNNSATGAPRFRYIGFFSEERDANGNVIARRAERPFTTFFDSRYQIQIGLRYRF